MIEEGMIGMEGSIDEFPDRSRIFADRSPGVQKVACSVFENIDDLVNGRNDMVVKGSLPSIGIPVFVEEPEAVAYKLGDIVMLFLYRPNHGGIMHICPLQEAVCGFLQEKKDAPENHAKIFLCFTCEVFDDDSPFRLLNDLKPDEAVDNQ